MKKLSKIELKDATKLVPTQMRDISGGMQLRMSRRTIEIEGFYGAAAAAPSNQCCFGDYCEDFPCKNNADCEAAIAPGATCKIVGGK